LQLFAALIVFSAFVALPAQAQTFKVLHTFMASKDGSYPFAGLTLDAKGNLYGTANQGGISTTNCGPTNSCGTVFELSPSGSGWQFKTLYAFRGGTRDGQGPYGAVTLGANGVLYGTTVDGGVSTCPSGCGLAYSLTPPVNCTTGPCHWTETILYAFKGNQDGFYPTGPLTLDAPGNLYGTTFQGGTGGPGIVFELSPSGSSWTETIVHNFNGSDGANPYNGAVFGPTGNLFASTLTGGDNNGGSVVELTPSGNSWTETILHLFTSTDPAGLFPVAGLLVEPSGTLIGATEDGGTASAGVVFSISQQNGTWTTTPLSDLSGRANGGPWGALIEDASGNLYGTTQGDPAIRDYGSVFKLSQTSSGWKETVLHRFTGGSDGSFPLSQLVLDSAGNLYGTTNLGGVSTNGGYGVIFEITP